MLKKYLFLIIFGLLSFFTTTFTTTSLALANPELPEIISEDTLLTSANSPYTCTNNLIIKENSTLSLEPNTILNISGSLVIQGKIVINPGAKIQVNGNLYRQPVDTSIDEYLNNQKLVVSGKIFNFSLSSSPEINNYLPTNPTNSKTPKISANFSDNTSQIDINTLIVILDGKDVTSQITNKDIEHFSYTPLSPQKTGMHNVQIFISNNNGLTSTKKWSFKINDTTPPKFDSYTPSPTTTSKKPVIKATFSDAESGIDIKTLKIYVDGKDVTSKIKVINNKSFTYTPSTSLNYGKHYVKVTIKNKDGFSSVKSWSFTLYDPKPPILKITSPLHNHTIYNRRPTISFTAIDKESGINLKTLVIQIDTKKFSTKLVKKNKKGYYFSPNYPLNSGKHSLKITIKDKSGHPATKIISFTVKTPGFTPGKNEIWIEVNQKTQRVYVMKGSKVTREIICSTGRPSTPTPNGIFRIQNRGNWFLAKGNIVGAKYWVSFKGYGKYMFHSILFDKKGKNIIGSSVRNLGHKASHGCIRLPLSDAKWLFGYIPANTRVVIFDK